MFEMHLISSVTDGW